MSTMVKFNFDGEYVSMRVVDREFKISSVYMRCSDLKRFRSEGYADLRDCDDYITLSKMDDLIHIKLTHVVPRYDGRIDGRQCHLYLKAEEFWTAFDLFIMKRVVAKCEASLLSQNPDRYPEIIFHCPDVLKVIQTDKKVRRAFSKYMRDAFKWRNSKAIHLYKDFVPFSFYFEEERKDDCRGICGGVILHRGTTRRGYEKVEYSTHT